MSSYRIRRLALSVACATMLVGCGWTRRAEVTQYREANRDLAAQSRMQLTEIANLKTHTRQIEDQLIAAEEALAQLARPTRGDRSAAPTVARDGVPVWKAVAEKPAVSAGRR